MKNLFQSVAIRKPRTNLFDLSHEKKLSCNMGELIPMFMQEVVPGDKFKVNAEIFMRLAPMTAPVMHRVNVYTHFFFVPNRLLWNNWESFITGGEQGDEAPPFPKLSINEAGKLWFQKGGLADYLGLPLPSQTVNNPHGISISALPFRAYQLIYNEYYRDQNLEDKINFTIGNDAQTEISTLTPLRRRAWEKDYFTSALPWSQRGGEVGIPVDFNYKPASIIKESTTGNLAVSQSSLTTDSAGNLSGTAATLDMRVENLEEEGVSVTVNELRQSVRLQEWLEKNARGGSRYIEQIFSHFGVKSSDARLQRPEYLGGGKQPIVISEVLASFRNEDVPLGDMAGHGISVGKTNSFSKYFEEHGIILGIMSVLPRTAYQQGIDKYWMKDDKFDFYFPEFANLGEQAVDKRELYMDYANLPTPTPYDWTFGYQSRFAEYKYKSSTVHADFRDTLSHWHMGRVFNNLPQLNAQFVQSNPTHDIFAVTDESVDKLYVQIYHDVKAIRPMPYFGTPTL